MGESGDHWDAEYRNRGVLYGGVPRTLPPFPPGTVVLELGCGDGKTLQTLCGEDRTVVAADYAPGAAARARTRHYPLPGPAFVVADARVLPFRDAVFDAIVASHILGHSTALGREAIAGEIRRLLRPGGYVWFRDFSDGDFRCGSGTPIEPGTFVRGTGIATHYFTGTEVRDLFCGFEPILMRSENWTLRVRGTAYPRSEIATLFRKSPVLP